MAGLPTGTVTFLFTDLEGSTRLWEEHPDAMRDALARHDEILRGVVEEHHGCVVKTTGDGLHAAFTTAHDAAEAAVDGQRRLGRESWPLPDPLWVRMGLHTGEAQIRDGDYYGSAVNRAARVAAAAHGGQILVSRATQELVADGLPDDVTLADLGEHGLRDLSRPTRLFEVRAADLPSGFPPPRSIDAFPGNLPPQLSSFVGREDDVADVAAALRAARLVTLTGVGGVGKTRLALQAAAQLLPYFADGGWLCELAAASNPDAMVQVVAASLGVSPRAGITLEASISEYLVRKDLLLVLDNCEHLLGPASRLAAKILVGSPGVRILATSREGLGIRGEQIRVVRSLPVPDVDAPIELVVASDAVRLFVDRARGARADFAMDAETAPAVAEICARLDGIPLAIELAAARAVAMAPGEIAEHLDERFRLLTGGKHTAVERHHTLRATVDWSYSLLDDRERTVFDRLGAFSGTFDAPAAQVVAGQGLGAWDVLDALTELVNKSMVLAEPGPSTTRYAMLETLRQYARERLDEREEADAARRAHTRHYVAVADDIGRQFRGGDEPAARDRLLTELDNVRAALTWALDSEELADREVALRTIAALVPVWWRDKVFGLGTWAERAVGEADAAEPEERALVLAAAAESRRTQVDIAECERLAREATRDGIAAARGGAALGYWVQSVLQASYAGDVLGAMRMLVDVRRNAADAGVEMWYQGSLAVICAAWAGFACQWDDARAMAQEALDIATELRAPSLLSSAHFSMANAIETMDPNLALVHYDDAIAIAEAGGFVGSNVSMLPLSARLLMEAGDLGGARRRLERGFRESREVGDWSEVAGVIAVSAAYFERTGNPESAAVLLGSVTDGPFANSIVSQGMDDDRFRIDDLFAGLRDALGDDGFRGASARGARMPIEELCTFAIAELTSGTGP